MIEAIRTFIGKLRGEYGNRTTVVQEGLLWRCTKCKLIFLTQYAGEQHDCKEGL